MESSYTTPPLNPEEPDQQVDNGSTMDPIQEEIPEEMELKINEGRIKHNSYDDTHFDNNIEHCNALTDSSETGIYITDNYHHLATHQKKENVPILKAIKQLTSTVSSMLHSSYKNDTWDQEKEKITKQLDEVNNVLQAEEKTLSDVSTLSDKFKQKLQQPKLGTNEKINIEEARLAVPLFSDDKDTANLQEFWHKLVCYSEAEKYSEQAVKNLLSLLLQGRPYRSFYENKNKSLQEICDILIDRFGSVSTISDKIKALDSITRKDNEKLSGVMSRVAELIEATKYLAKETERDVRYEILMTNNLLKIASSKAKQAMLIERTKAARSGYILKYRDLLAIAIEIERQENESDNTDWYAFPVVRAQKHRPHKEKPYDGYKPPSFEAQAPNQNSALVPRPNFNSDSKPLTQRHGNSDYRNINDHYRQNTNRNRSQKDYNPRYNYQDNYQNNQYNKQWDNYGGRPDNRNNFKPKIYQGYGNYARHKYPPYPMECFDCGLYHYGKCANNYQYEKNYNYKNNRNNLN